MNPPDDLPNRLAQLQENWPASSIVTQVMARIEPAGPFPARNRRLLLGLSLSGLAASLLLAWFLVLGQPKSLLASVQQSLQKAGSAILTITAWDDRNSPHTFTIHYLRGAGLRAELPDEVMVEDGTNQWTWRNGSKGQQVTVLRQRSPGFFTSGILSRLALPDFPVDWEKSRSPRLDREVDGHPCRAFTIALSDLEKLPPGAKPADGLERRVQLLAEPDGRIRLVTIERQLADHTWKPEREIQIAYDAPVPPDSVAANLPENSRVIDCDRAFDSLYPLEKALHRVEKEGLLFAVHDLQPLENREGFYVVSSVRGTSEFLKQYPPRRRPLNPQITFLDVAFQPMGNRMYGGKYDLIVLGNANREGVEFSWWIVVPRRFFFLKDGKRDYLPEDDISAMPGEPGRLDSLPGVAQIPLSATCWSEKLRDSRGVAKQVSTWEKVPIPADRPPASWEVVTARARQDLLIMAVGDVGWLFGVAASTSAAKNELRSISPFKPDAISDADFAAAVRRGLDDLRTFDEVQNVSMPGVPPGP